MNNPPCVPVDTIDGGESKQKRVNDMRELKGRPRKTHAPVGQSSIWLLAFARGDYNNFYPPFAIINDDDI